MPPPELTYLNYAPLKSWLAAKLNANTPWDEVVRELITATGKIEDQPAATLVGYHQANATNLAAETSRIFLGQQIGCAECHDHPFDHWKRTQFHELAAFFARTKAKLPRNDGAGTVVSSADKGEYLMPDIDDPSKKGTPDAAGVFWTATRWTAGPERCERRGPVGRLDHRRATIPGSPGPTPIAFGRRLMGRGFYEPVDDLGDSRRADVAGGARGAWPALRGHGL